MSGEEEEVGDDTSSDNEDEEMVVSVFFCAHGTLNRDTPDGEFGYPVYSSIRRHIVRMLVAG